MFIKLIRKSTLEDFNNKVVYVNTDNIIDMYAIWVEKDGENILWTNINTIDGSMYVAESPEKIFRMIQHMAYYLNTDTLSAKEKKDLCKLFLNGLYGTSIYPNSDEPCTEK